MKCFTIRDLNSDPDDGQLEVCAHCDMFVFMDLPASGRGFGPNMEGLDEEQAAARRQQHKEVRSGACMVTFCTATCLCMARHRQ